MTIRRSDHLLSLDPVAAGSVAPIVRQNNMEREKRAIYPHHGRRYDTDPNKFYIRSALKCADGVRSYLKDHPAESELTLLSQLIALQQTELWCPMATKFFQNHNAD